MKPHLALPAAAALLLAASLSRAAAPRFAAGRVLLKLKPAASGTVGPASAGAQTGTSALTRLSALVGAKSAAPLAGGGGIGPAAAGSAASIDQLFPVRAARAPKGMVAPDLSSFYVLTLSTDADVEAAARALAADPAVAEAEPDAMLELQDYMATSGSWQSPTNWDLSGDAADTYPDMWALKIMQTDRAWQLGYKGAGVLVGLVDTGVDYNHPDIQAAIQKVGGFWGVNFIDTTIDPKNTNGPNDPMDTYGHGTHTAGIVAAQGNDGVWGIAPDAKLLIARAAPSGLTTSDAVLGIKWAVDHGADVISCSWGGTIWNGSDVSALTQALDYAEAHGVVVVAAAGNYGQTLTSAYLPAGYPTVIGVAASTSKDTVANWSNSGGPTSVAAPGGDDCAGGYSACPQNIGEFTLPAAEDRHAVLSLRATQTRYSPHFGVDAAGLYYRMGGTSMSSPMAAGVVALMLSAKPALTTAQVRQMLKSSADDIGNPAAGAGRVDAYKAVLTALGQPIPGTPVISNVVATPGPNDATITWTTDIPASGSVWYGASAGNYTDSATDPNTATKSHSVHLTGLAASTVYHFVVRSAGGGTASSTDASFATTAPARTVTITWPAPGSTVPPGFLTVQAKISDSTNIGFVFFYDNGQPIGLGGREVGAGGLINFDWDTWDFKQGETHTLTAKAYLANGTNGLWYPQTEVPTYTPPTAVTIGAVETSPVTLPTKPGIDVWFLPNEIFGYQHDWRTYVYLGTTPLPAAPQMRPQHYQLALMADGSAGTTVVGQIPGWNDWSAVTLPGPNTYDSSPVAYLTLPSTSTFVGKVTLEARVYDQTGQGVQSVQALVQNASGVTVSTISLANAGGRVWRADWDSTAQVDGVYYLRLRAVENGGKHLPYDPGAGGIWIHNGPAAAADMAAALVSPSDGATLSGSWAITAESCDAPAKMELYDGTKLVGAMNQSTTGVGAR